MTDIGARLFEDFHFSVDRVLRNSIEAGVCDEVDTSQRNRVHIGVRSEDEVYWEIYDKVWWALVFDIDGHSTGFFGLKNPPENSLTP